MGTATVFIGVFSLVTISLFCTFIYLLSTVDPEIKSRPISIDFVTQLPPEAPPADDIKQPEEIRRRVIENLEENHENQEETPEEPLEKPGEPDPEERRKKGLRNIKKPGRRSNVLVRIVDKNYNVLKVAKQSNNGTVGKKSYFDNSTTPSNDSMTTPPVKGVRRSANEKLNKIPHVILLKLLPNNTFILEEDFEV